MDADPIATIALNKDITAPGGEPPDPRFLCLLPGYLSQTKLAETYHDRVRAYTILWMDTEAERDVKQALERGFDHTALQNLD